MEKPIPIHKAKANLSRLIEKALKGEVVIIAKGQTPIVRLVPVGAKGMVKRSFGAMKGRAVVGDEFFEPLPETELDAWE